VSRVPPPRLRLEIGQLHLHGFEAGAPDVFTQSLERALQALAASGPTAGERRPIVDAFRHQAGSSEPEAAAQELAEALWTRFGASGRPSGRGPP